MKAIRGWESGAGVILVVIVVSFWEYFEDLVSLIYALIRHMYET